MLYSVETGRYVDKIPHQKDYLRWRARLSDADYHAVMQAISDAVGDSEVSTAGWLPGSNWTGTAYEPLYYACGKNAGQAGMFFGLLVFEHLMRRDDRVWGFGRFERNGVPISSMTYFVLDNAPERQ